MGDSPRRLRSFPSPKEASPAAGKARALGPATHTLPARPAKGALSPDWGPPRREGALGRANQIRWLSLSPGLAPWVPGRPPSGPQDGGPRRAGVQQLAA